MRELARARNLRVDVGPLLMANAQATKLTQQSLRIARFLWQPNAYDLILLDVRRHLPGEALEFYEQIGTASPKEHFAFLVGPPVYLSRTWPGEVTEVDASQGQWGATVGRFLTAA
jgi:hypothetical protein